MNILTIELKKVTAAEGMTLTNGIEFSKEIYLGINDSADNWREITDTEADEIKKTMLPEEPED
ncbi:MAG: hypothetical protein IKB89_05505 [Clostridia bacterium]|nr:hypothetical protein [Clostridia bacterium]